MTQVPAGQTMQGYQPPFNTQFSVFLDNRCGKLLELVEIFDDQDLDIVALSVIDAADHAVVRLVTSRSDLARQLLREHSAAFSEAQILVVELSPGRSLAQLCMFLLSAELNIHFAYSLMMRPHGICAIALHTDDQLLAGQILQRKLFTLLGENDMLGMGPDDDSDNPFQSTP